MKDVLNFIRVLKISASADFVLIGNKNEGGYVVIILKGEFTQRNIMQINTESTINSIATDFLRSYSEHLEALK